MNPTPTHQIVGYTHAGPEPVVLFNHQSEEDALAELNRLVTEPFTWLNNAVPLGEEIASTVRADIFIRFFIRRVKETV